MTDIVCAAMRPNDDAQRSRTSVDVGSIQVSPRTALALAMALHELATNAAKYGALTTADGRVSIQWAADGAEHIRLDWQESNGPPVHPPVRRGFGSRLLQSGLAVELGTSAELEYAPAGLNCEIRAPVRGAAAVRKQHMADPETGPFGPLAASRRTEQNAVRLGGGRGGIRTHGTLARTAVFKTAALNRSATRPRLRAS
jgi:light-regulated signal transduction histidine kinase (bacteriophytochrome)